MLKLFDKDLSGKFKKFRFKLYEIEKVAVNDLAQISQPTVIPAKAGIQK